MPRGPHEQYLQYKADTEEIEIFLARKAVKHSFPIDEFRPAIRSKIQPVDGDETRDEPDVTFDSFRSADESAVISPSQSALDLKRAKQMSNRAKRVAEKFRKNEPIIKVGQFVKLAQFLAKKKVRISNRIHRVLLRCIKLRLSTSKFFWGMHGWSASGHLYFVKVLKSVLSILTVQRRRSSLLKLTAGRKSLEQPVQSSLRSTPGKSTPQTQTPAWTGKVPSQPTFDFRSPWTKGLSSANTIPLQSPRWVIPGSSQQTPTQPQSPWRNQASSSNSTVQQQSPGLSIAGSAQRPTQPPSPWRNNMSSSNISAQLQSPGLAIAGSSQCPPQPSSPWRNKVSSSKSTAQLQSPAQISKQPLPKPTQPQIQSPWRNNPSSSNNFAQIQRNQASSSNSAVQQQSPGLSISGSAQRPNQPPSPWRNNSNSSKSTVQLQSPARINNQPSSRPTQLPMQSPWRNNPSSSKNLAQLQSPGRPQNLLPQRAFGLESPKHIGVNSLPNVAQLRTPEKTKTSSSNVTPKPRGKKRKRNKSGVSRGPPVLPTPERTQKSSVQVQVSSVLQTPEKTQKSSAQVPISSVQVSVSSAVRVNPAQAMKPTAGPVQSTAAPQNAALPTTSNKGKARLQTPEKIKDIAPKGKVGLQSAVRSEGDHVQVFQELEIPAKTNAGCADNTASDSSKQIGDGDVERKTDLEKPEQVKESSARGTTEPSVPEHIKDSTSPSVPEPSVAEQVKESSERSPIGLEDPEQAKDTSSRSIIEPQAQEKSKVTSSESPVKLRRSARIKESILQATTTGLRRSARIKESILPTPTTGLQRSTRTKEIVTAVVRRSERIRVVQERVSTKRSVK
ncbi:hypothetical protein A4X09_0g257 [Tilletia walkeri]|uniref:DUF6604 domain-containing protein n=1 Tax=Tilletia walkeri TaxID=117179 RepID=A0A8X7NH43_9BASI|nr:hypothetical protein A4X09_0g257 [Tilletia walkeri]